VLEGVCRPSCLPAGEAGTCGSKYTAQLMFELPWRDRLLSMQHLCSCCGVRSLYTGARWLRLLALNPLERAAMAMSIDQ
jgi:hypothetical protein